MCIHGQCIQSIKLRDGSFDIAGRGALAFSYLWDRRTNLLWWPKSATMWATKHVCCSQLISSLSHSPVAIIYEQSIICILVINLCSQQIKFVRQNNTAIMGQFMATINIEKISTQPYSKWWNYWAGIQLCTSGWKFIFLHLMAAPNV